MTSDLLTALRRDTAPAHQALETEIDFLKTSLALDRYVQTLRIFEAFVRRWEAVAEQSCPEQLAELFRGRRRAHLLRADLDFFEASPLDAEPALSPLNTPSALWGAFYVMEGSTLGGQVIARHLQSSLRLSGGHGYSYFLGYGAATGSKWKEFTGLLTDASPSLIQHEVIAAANATFEAFRAFYAERAKESTGSGSPASI